MNVKTRRGNWFERLGSMSLAIVLLVVLAMASVIGTILLQNQDPTDYLRQFGPLWYWTFRILGLFDVYHTWWFLGLLAFLMVSLGACLWRNTPRMIKETRARRVVIPEKSLKRFHHLHTKRLRQDEVQPVLHHLRRILKGWYIQQQDAHGRIYLRADKGRYNKFGYILTHAAILIILIGGWVSVQFGFRGNMNVVEHGREHTIRFLKGSEVQEMDLPFTVQCNDFFIDFYPTGQPKEFRSNLTIIDGGKPVLTQDIRVNEPLYYKGVRIYQASFGDGGSKLRLKLYRQDSGRIDTIESRVYETYQDESSGISLEFTNFLPYNVENMAEPGQPKDFQDLGPAVEYIIRGPNLRPVKVKSFLRPLEINGENRGSFMLISLTGDGKDYQPYFLGIDLSNPKEWELYQAFIRRIANLGKERNAEENIRAFRQAIQEVFGENKPDDIQQLGMRLLQAVNAIPSLPWPFVPMLDDFEQIYYTGLQLTRDPGMNIVWIGSAILVIGLCLMLYFPHRKLWAVIEHEGETTRMVIAGSTNRNRIAFEKEFHVILTHLDQVMMESKPTGGPS